MPRPACNVGLWQQQQNKMMIIGGFDDGYALNSIYMFREKASGFDVTKSKLNMDAADFFRINGVYFEDPSKNEIVIAGERNLHRLSDKNTNVKFESEIEH